MVKWVICTGPDWYRPSVASTRQIINQFYQNGYHILWVNAVPFKAPGVNSVSAKSRFKKIINKAVTQFKIFKRVKKSYFVFVPFYIPAFSKKAESINRKLIGLQLSILKRILSIKDPESILISAGTFTLLPEYSKQYFRKIYQAGDYISDFRTENSELKQYLREREKELCEKSDIIFASSRLIREKLSCLTSKRIDLLLHGVNFSHFNEPKVPAIEILNIKNKLLPIAGYFGSLSDANDLKVFAKLAANGFSVVIIGKILGDYTSLDNIPNIYIMGPINYNRLPSYGQAFDVCLMNWKMAEWIKNSFPIKTLEYLAMGKPVISVDIPIVKELFSDLVYFAEDEDDFVEKARMAIRENCEERVRARIESVRNYDWSDRYKILKSRIFDE